MLTSHTKRTFVLTLSSQGGGGGLNFLSAIPLCSVFGLENNYLSITNKLQYTESETAELFNNIMTLSETVWTFCVRQKLVQYCTCVFMLDLDCQATLETNYRTVFIHTFHFYFGSNQNLDLTQDFICDPTFRNESDCYLVTFGVQPISQRGCHTIEFGFSTKSVSSVFSTSEK